MQKQPIIPEFTGEEYLRWESARPEKYELHFGFIVSFAGGTLGHDRIAFAMRSALENRLVSCVTFGSDVKVMVAHDSYFYPNATVVRGEVDFAATEILKPTIVVEVLSPSTQAYDRIDKRAAYRKLPSLRAIVIVHTETRRVEVDDRGGMRGAWHSICYDDATHARIGDIELPLDEIYGPMPTA